MSKDAFSYDVFVTTYFSYTFHYFSYEINSSFSYSSDVSVSLADMFEVSAYYDALAFCVVLAFYSDAAFFHLAFVASLAFYYCC